jgi:hypothetical protein
MYSWTKVHSYRFKCSRTVVTQKCPFAVSYHPSAWTRATISSCLSSVSTSLSRVLLLSRAEIVVRNFFTDLNFFGVLATCAPGLLRLNFGRHYLRDRIWHTHRAETPRSVMPTAKWYLVNTETTSATNQVEEPRRIGQDPFDKEADRQWPTIWAIKLPDLTLKPSNDLRTYVLIQVYTPIPLLQSLLHTGLLMFTICITSIPYIFLQTVTNSISTNKCV